MDESELIRRAREGDQAAYEELLRALVEPGAALAFAMLYDRSAAEDAFQEVAIRGWQRLGNLRPGSSFRPWFLGIGLPRGYRAVTAAFADPRRGLVVATDLPPFQQPPRVTPPPFHEVVLLTDDGGATWRPATVLTGARS